MIKILIVDDDQFEREGIRYLFHKLFDSLGEGEAGGYAIKDVRNGRLALDLLEREYFDLVITDIKMPVMDGMALLERAIQLREGVTYIIYSGYNDFEYAKQAMHLHVTDFLVKPVKETEFYELMSRVIKKVRVEKKERRRYKLLSLFYGKEPLYQVSFDCLHTIQGRLVYAPMDRRSLESYTDRLEKLNRQNIMISLGERGKMIWLWGGCKDREEIETSLRYLFSGLEGVFLVSGKLLSMDSLETQYRELLEWGGGIAVRDPFTILHVRDLEETGRMEENLIGPSGSFSPVSILQYLGSQAFLTERMKNILANRIQNSFEENGEELGRMVREACSISEIEDSLGGCQKDKEVIARVKSYIKKNYMRDISVGEIGDSIFLNAAYLSTVFKKETGTTIINYLMDYRMKKAMELLKIKDMKISEIAMGVGYHNISYFNAIFRQKTGLTPNQYRKRIHENEKA